MNIKENVDLNEENGDIYKLEISPKRILNKIRNHKTKTIVYLIISA